MLSVSEWACRSIPLLVRQETSHMHEWVVCCCPVKQPPGVCIPARNPSVSTTVTAKPSRVTEKTAMLQLGTTRNAHLPKTVEMDMKSVFGARASLKDIRFCQV